MIRNKDLVELTASMIINDVEFGTTVGDRPTAQELGLALVKANAQGLRLIKGGKRTVKSELVAAKLLNQLGKELHD
jgi:hypothetical protein